MATIGKHGVLPQEQSEIPKPGFQSLLSIHLQYSITPKNTSMDPDMPLNIVNSSKPILLLVIYIYTVISLFIPVKPL